MKYIGVAVGQTITKTATPLCSITAVNGIPNWDQIAQLIQDWQPQTIIVGKPLNMDDSTQHLTFCAVKFANRLRNKYKVPVELVDERLSTWEAKQRLFIKDARPTASELTEVNATAAAILLEQWLQQ
jgi:putative holliday junction resolvase